MDIALWVVQVILGIKLITVTWTHGLRQSQPTMQTAIEQMGMLARPLLFGAAIITLLGTLGLILPGLLGASPWITIISAGLMGLSLLVSLFFHIRSREKPKIFVSLVLFAFAAFVAYGRWMLMQ